ncbi:TPA: endonuclease/exonuclease/phosphatase family protein [Streptococcus suis]|nr:endonuclease/exonuclease/phosphatase family protein [Streptococcus suis]HEM5184331.1 endonuclease/exonuclease/phosphatase family protein [Streptococcus suis]
MNLLSQENKEITIVTFNVQGKKVTDVHKPTKFRNYSGFNFENLSFELKEMKINPDIISLTEVHIVDLQKISKNLNQKINEVDYKAFTPKQCTQNESYNETSLGTCLLVRENIAKYFSLCDAQIVNKVMYHKGKTCDIRECRIKSHELEVVSLYIKSGLSKNDKKSKETLKLLTEEMSSKLKSPNKTIYLGDFNFNINHPGFVNEFQSTVKDFKEIVSVYEPWYKNYAINDEENLFTYRDCRGDLVKLDYIISNLEIKEFFSSQEIPIFSDHKILVSRLRL